jgi:hypothetical protein
MHTPHTNDCLWDSQSHNAAQRSAAHLLLLGEAAHDVAPGLGPVGEPRPEAAAQLHALLTGLLRQQLHQLHQLRTLHDAEWNNEAVKTARSGVYAFAWTNLCGK